MSIEVVGGAALRLLREWEAAWLNNVTVYGAYNGRLFCTICNGGGDDSSTIKHQPDCILVLTKELLAFVSANKRKQP